MKKLLFFFIICCFSIHAFSQGDTLYGLNFTTGQLRFASMDVNSGQVNIMSSAAISPDAYQQGVGDFDPINKIYYYPRGGGNSAQIISVDALTGNVINASTMPNTNNAVVPITNIAYNWLNDTLYGLNHVYSGGEQLKLVSVDPTSGNINMISSNPISTTPYLSGNSDIDVIHRRYFYATASRIYTVDLDDGTTIFDKSINFPQSVSGQFMVNLTYNWFNGLLYGLYFSPDPNANPWSTYTAQLQLATIDPATGNINILSSTALSPDGFSMGDCDIDPVSNRYFYIRAGQLYTVDLTTGNLLSTTTIQNPNNAVMPITNIAYDDFKLPPNDPSRMNMGDTIIISAGQSIELDAYVGDGATYLWNNGSTNSSIEVTTSGLYSVKITKDVFTVEGEIEIIVNSSVNTTNVESIKVKIFPNPANDFINYETESDNNSVDIVIFDMKGQELIRLQKMTSNGQIDISKLPSGIYYLSLNNGTKVITEKIIIE